MDLIKKYFPEIDDEKIEKLREFSKLITIFNNEINVISRKDIVNIETNHILHSLAIAKFLRFERGSKVLDIGTGGGFPGIPLAVFFPDSEFLLVDSIGKKIKVVQSIISQLDLKNAKALNCRVETLKQPKVNFVVSRAVAPISLLYIWSKHLVSPLNNNKTKNGFIMLKGGDINEEKRDFSKNFKYRNEITEINLSCYFKDDFFETKKLIYFPH